MKKIFCLTLLLLLSFQVFSQIEDSERLVFVASYNMSGLMTQLAQVTMETQKVSTSRNTFLHLKVTASTFSRWDSYFRIRDVYESYVNPQTLVPSLYNRDVSEGSYTKKEKYVYQPDRRTVNATVRRGNDEEQNRTFTKRAEAVDIVAAIYQLRKVDISKLSVGQTIPIVIIFDEKEVNAQIRYMGKETRNVGKLGRKECYKLSIAASTDVLKGRDRNLIWLTADDNKIPVFMQFSIPVGTGQLELTEMRLN